jgi:hypothetical protein
MGQESNRLCRKPAPSEKGLITERNRNPGGYPGRADSFVAPQDLTPDFLLVAPQDLTPDFLLIDQVAAAIVRARCRPDWYDEIPDYREEIY